MGVQHRYENCEWFAATKMNQMQTRALLIGESSQGSLHLMKHLEGYRCDCRCVTSYQEARSLLKVQRFDLVLSPIRLRESSLFPFVSKLEGPQITPGKDFVHKGVDKAGNQLGPISHKSLDLTLSWDSFDIHHDLTTKGIQGFVADYRSTLKQSA